LKVLGGFFNYVVIRATKKVLPGFVHGLNTGDLQKKLNTSMGKFKDPVLVSWDGSSHDRN